MRLFSVCSFLSCPQGVMGKWKTKSEKWKMEPEGLFVFRSSFFTYLHYLRSDIVISTFYVRLTALRRDTMPFSPTLRIGLNDLALSGFFQRSANNSAWQRINNSTPEEHTRAESPNYFSPIPQGWGIDDHSLLGGLKAWHNRYQPNGNISKLFYIFAPWTR